MAYSDHYSLSPRLICLLSVFCCCLPLGIAADSTESNGNDRVDNSAEAPPTTVQRAAKTMRLNQQPAATHRHFTAFGQPWRQQTISAEVGGKVVHVSIDVGEVVADAQTLLTIDTSRLDADAARLDATLAAIAAARELLAQDIALAERRLAFQKREYERNEALAASGSVSATRLDSITLARDEAQLTLNRNKLREAELAAQQAQVEADRQDITWQRQRASIVGQAGWTVRERHVHPGSIIQPGLALFDLADTRTQRLTFFLDSDEIAALHAGNGRLTLKDQPETLHPATIAWIDPVPDHVTGKRRVHCDINLDQKPSVNSGASWELVLTLPDPTGGWQIPNEFLLQQFDNWYLTTVTGQRHAVVVLRREGEQSVIARPNLPPATELRTP
jgi:multidrug efflux pump subunit AcrA (membrane-fusion protein)